MRLTEEQKDAYLRSKGVRCPFCRSRNLTSGRLQSDADVALADVKCDDCGAEWTDRYALVGIDESRGP